MAKQKMDRAERISRKEKIENTFLLQFTYIIVAAMFLLFIYNGRLYRYGAKFANMLPEILWTLTAILGVVSVVFLVLYFKNKADKYKTLSIYSIITTLYFYWCIGLEKIFIKIRTMYQINKPDSIITYLANAKNLLQLLFVALGVAFVICTVIYIYNLRNINKQIRVAKKRALKK